MRHRLWLYASGFALAARSLAVTPFPVGAKWEPSRGPQGGVVNALAAVGDSLYAGCNRGLYRRLASEEPWRLTSIPLDTRVAALANSGGVLLVGADPRGVFRSVDDGESWTQANDGLPAVAYLSVRAFAVSGGNVYALVNGALYASIDAGISWTPRGPTPALFNSILAVGGTLYGTANPISPMVPTGGVYRSDDGGTTWEMGAGISSSEYVWALSDSNGILYAATESGVFQSYDLGRHWARTGLVGVSVTAVLNVGSSLYAALRSGGLLKSEDGGQTWIPTGHPQTVVLALSAVGSTVYSGTYLGVFDSVDAGNSWSGRNDGLTNTYTAGIWTAGSDVYALISEFTVIGFPQNTLYRSPDSGKTWVASSAGLPVGAYVSSFVTDGSALYAGVPGFGVYKSVDRGASWTPASSGIPVASDEFFTLAARGDLVVVAIHHQVGALTQIFRSADAGGSWTGPSTGPDGVTKTVFDGHALYAGTVNGVSKSLDGGASWHMTGLQQFTRLVAVAHDAVYAVTSTSGVLRSTDGGNEWQRTALARDDIYSLTTVGPWVFAANVGNALGAGRSDDVFVTADQGETWDAVEDNLFVAGGVSLAASDTTLYGGTQGYGVQALKLQPDRERIQSGPRRLGPRVVNRGP